MAKVEKVLERVYLAERPAAEDIKCLLEAQGRGVEAIFDLADSVRRERVGDEVLIRGIVEFSNYCQNGCKYCGLNAGNSVLRRYKLNKEQILEVVGEIAAVGVKTVVLQSGESTDEPMEWMAEVVREIKVWYEDMAVTLSIGEKSFEEYRLLREAGADRYLLKIETTDAELYAELHPGMSFDHRLGCIADLKELGYQTGSGVIVGLPGQTKASLARDILFFKEWDIDMIGIGAFIPHEKTALAGCVRASVEETLKVVAVTRIITGGTHLPATTALQTLEAGATRQALNAGANVIMPDFTPFTFRGLYDIYPGKNTYCRPKDQIRDILELAERIGRSVRFSKGDCLGHKWQGYVLKTTL